MKILQSMLTFTVMVLSTVGYSQSLNVGTGSATGTYSALFKDMGKVCVNTAFLKESHTGGSLDNIDLLLNNKVSLAFLQVDVLKAKEQIDQDTRVSEIKTLLPLHKEEVHVITKAGTHKDGIFSKAVEYNTLADFKNKTIAAYGGSVITAKVINSFSSIGYKISVYNDQRSALAALDAGKVDGILAVVGQPAEWISKLSTSYKLISIPLTPKLSSLYSSAKLSYPNLSLSSVNTISVQSVLATRDFKTVGKKEQLLKYASCVRSHLIDLQETEGYHPKWNDVVFEGFTAWPLYK